MSLSNPLVSVMNKLLNTLLIFSPFFPTAMVYFLFFFAIFPSFFSHIQFRTVENQNVIIKNDGIKVLVNFLKITICSGEIIFGNILKCILALTDDNNGSAPSLIPHLPPLSLFFSFLTFFW